MNLNHREIERLEGLVEAYKKKAKALEEWMFGKGNTTPEPNIIPEWDNIKKEIEFYSNHKNF